MTYSVGIDLGTTNCALSFVRAKDPAATTELMPIPQREDLRTVADHSTLPSFLYLPHPSETVEGTGKDFGLVDGWAVGTLARKRTANAPSRVVHSAKSWLANAAAEPTARVLPWRSEDVSEDRKLSSLSASAALLTHLRESWNAHFAAEGDSSDFNRQTVVITVPASFNAAAQQATLDAAAEAGFPRTVRLLEEPQAAFYRFLETSGAGSFPLAEGQHVLVIDVGGGTSDFSLFQIDAPDSDGLPRIQRVAVSDHILLGGDNIDLALAHVLEAELAPEGEELEGDAWSHLLARSRELTERCLSAAVDETENLHVAIPRSGAGLFASTLSASVAVGQVREILLEGFFPLCDRDARPEESSSALHEWGLPYASDFAVTRYLADFLRGQPLVDAVLFNGGTLASPLIRDRMLDALGQWQDETRPITLENPEPFHAVARGAAYYGALRARGASQIQSGAARAIFLETAAPDGASNFVCVLPRGAEPEEVFTAAVPGLQLELNQPVRFQAYQAAHHRDEAAGDVVPWTPEDFTALPPLETRASWESDKTSSGRIPVQLEGRINELGILQVDLVGRSDGETRRWPLKFNVRATAEAVLPQRPATLDPGVEPDRLERARSRLRMLLADSSGSGGRLTAASVFTALEKVIGQPRHDWNLLLVRELADALLEIPEVLGRSPEHGEVWLSLAGYLLRPGFGGAADEERIERVWSTVRAAGPTDRRRKLQELILWRRIAGGLTERQQAELLAEIQTALQSGNATSEHIRLTGSLERMPVLEKEALAERFSQQAVAQVHSGGYAAPCLVAVGQLLNRHPLHGGFGNVPPPESVERAFQTLKKLDWEDAKANEAVGLFLRAARIVEDPRLNLAQRSRKRIADKLRQSKVAPARLLPLEQFIPVGEQDRADLYQEALPPGLILE